MIHSSDPIRASWKMYVESEKTYMDSVDRQLKFLRNHAKSTMQLLRADHEDCIGTVLLIEPRKHPLTEFVLRNWVYFLAPLGWSLTIAHGSDNAEQVREITKGWSAVQFIPLPKDDLPGIEYNKLLTLPDFWEAVPHETILLVQTDTMCLSAKGFGGDDGEFLEYDYVGAPWHQSCAISGRVFRTGTVCKPSTMTDD